MSKLIYSEESFKIRQACFAVHNVMGSGFLEAVYQECLALELEATGIPFIEQHRVALKYKGNLLKQAYQPDFLCSGCILIEIKAVKTLTDEHRAQVINYLKATGLQLALLVNFGSHPKAQIERFINLGDQDTTSRC